MKKKSTKGICFNYYDTFSHSILRNRNIKNKSIIYGKINRSYNVVEIESKIINFWHKTIKERTFNL